MDITALLTILLNILVVVLIAVSVYILLLLFEVRQSLHRANSLIGKIEAIADFVNTKIIRTGSSAAVYLGLIKQFVNFAANLRGTLKKESPRSKKGEENE